MKSPALAIVPAPVAEPTARPLDAAIHRALSRANGGISPIALLLGYTDWALHWAIAPQHHLEVTADAVRSLVSGLLPRQDAVVEADSRFKDPGWDQWPFRAWRSGFKAAEGWWNAAAIQDGMSQHDQELVRFYTRQWLDMLSPSNAPLTNPEVLQRMTSTLGTSWLEGLQHCAHDMQLQQQSRLRAADAPLPALPFVPGKDVAVTPGKVVFRNRLIEVIHYTPSTATVYPDPVLIVPSCIMKYYILDLSPGNSMVRYLVSQGHPVYAISWRNPDESDRDLGLQDYLELGVMDAMRAVRQCSGASSIHALGYCLGGTFLAMVAAAMGRHEQLHKGRGQGITTSSGALDGLPALRSMTLLAAQTDFSEPGELGVFIDADQLRTLRESMGKKGYMSGPEMAGAFQFLNARDLIWTRNMRRYLLGEEDTGNDMLSWNADVTRLPERMHNEYLSTLFLNNGLAQGHCHVCGLGVALMDIRMPILVVGTQRDHVSPWHSVYKIHLQTDTHTTFILASGGHNAGIVSEPGHSHRSYQIDSVEAGHGWEEPDDWAARVPTVEGSWWEAMHDWLDQRSGARVKVRVKKGAVALCDAPGEYVMTRYAD